MVPKEFTRIRELRRKLDALSEREEVIRAAASRATVSLDGMPHAKGDKSSVEKYALRLTELNDAKTALTFELETAKLAALEVIWQLSKKAERDTLRLMYVELKGAEEISEMLDCSLPTVWRLRREGLLKLGAR